MPNPKRNSNGTWTIPATFGGRRCTLTLGNIDRSKAQLFASCLELLCSQKRHGQTLEPETVRWVNQLSPKHREQLANIGLITGFNSAMTVEDLIETFLDDYQRRVERREICGSSLTQFRSAMLRFPESFGKMKLNDIQPIQYSEQASSEPIFEPSVQKRFVEINSWQRNHYASSSWSRANGRIREIGKWAVSRGYCKFNPFVLLPKPKQIDESRNAYVERDWILDAMAQCSHPDTRLLFVLGRFCGLRLLSEARTLKPQHVDYQAKVLSIFDSKKQAFRQMPLFNMVAQEFQRHAEITGWFTENTGLLISADSTRRYVLTNDTLSASDSAATNKMKNAVKKSGHDQWPRANQNLRSSCENDLLRQGFSERLVTAWLGHTVEVSRNHYQKLFAEDYQDAVNRSSY